MPEPIDIVDVFLKPMFLDETPDAVGAKTFWAQLGVVSSDQKSERKAKAAGLNVVSNCCMGTKHERLQIPPRSIFTRKSRHSSNQ